MRFRPEECVNRMTRIIVFTHLSIKVGWHMVGADQLVHQKKLMHLSQTKINVNFLAGPALDWAVAMCEPDDTLGVYFDDQTGEALVHDDWPDFQQYTPSTNWAQAGPIIEREGIAIFLKCSDEWAASDGFDAAKGPTPLIAAMRCYVASKLGEIVGVPRELYKED